MSIRVLPGNIANMIAAGEVVQRPASVVKELMENAVDALSTQISVSITDSGRTLIRVCDNGCGMSAEESVLCFERHATSKIAVAEDLENILTYGFRGEALASIAAVAEVTLRTRKQGQELGHVVEMAASQLISSKEGACPAGCDISVRNLFYNVPARRKFLKSDNVEFKHIVEEFTRVALTRPQVGFSLSHNGRSVYNLRPTSALKQRLQELMGRSLTDSLADISAQTSILDVKGFIGRPDLAKKTLGNQFFFVNGRYFRSPYLHKAVMKAYENLIPEGVAPSYFLYLKVDPHSVDVNIHPTKAEIKFEDDSMVFQVLYACVREAVWKNSFGSAIDFDETDALKMPVFSSHYNDFRPDVNQPSVGVDHSFNPFEDPKSQDYPNAGYTHKNRNYGALFEDNSCLSSVTMVLGGKYILSEVPSGVLVVNVRRAHERIFYERFLSALSRSGHSSQTALFPVTLTIGVAGQLLLAENAELLAQMGFDFSLSGNDAVVVSGVPEGLSPDEPQVEAAVGEILIALEDRTAFPPGITESVTAERFARIAASRATKVNSPVEAQRLVDTLFGCENSEFTCKGLKTMAIIKTEEIDKKFS